MHSRSLVTIGLCLLASGFLRGQCPPNQVILDGASLGTGVQVGLNTSQGETDWLSNNGSMLIMQYPPDQAWGTVFFTFGPAEPVGQRTGKDMSSLPISGTHDDGRPGNSQRRDQRFLRTR
jgi:hypothetical protein